MPNDREPGPIVPAQTAISFPINTKIMENQTRAISASKMCECRSPMHYVDKPPPLTLFLTPKGVGIGREKGVAFGRDLTGLRAFLRYLSARSQCPADLDRAVPAFASWRLADCQDI